MNRVILMGRLTRDPDIRYTQSENPKCIARYTLAVDRFLGRTTEDSQTADFIPCIAFGKTAEFVEKYLKQGTKIAIEGHLLTGSYTNKEGQKVFTMEVVIEKHEFAENKNKQPVQPANNAGEDGFVSIPDEMEDEGLPFPE